MTVSWDWMDAKSILCIRLDNMGDVLMTTPALRALKQTGQGRRLTLLASGSGALVAPFISEVDATIVYDAAWVKNSATGRRQDTSMIRTLENLAFDAAVIFTVYSQSALPAALMCHLAGIPAVLAYSRENPYRLLSHRLRETEPESGVRHEVQRHLDLVASVGAACADTRLSFSTLRSDRDAMVSLLGTQSGRDISLRSAIVVHCGATAPSRRYDPELFAQALSLLEVDDAVLIFTGSDAERELVQKVMGACRPGLSMVNLAGRLSLGEFACLIEEAALLISNNTGPVHIAAALQTPVLDLYALTNPQHTPWQVPSRVLSHDVPCKYCYASVCPRGTNACLNGIAPQQVANAARELLQQKNRDSQEKLCTL